MEVVFHDALSSGICRRTVCNCLRRGSKAHIDEPNPLRGTPAHGSTEPGISDCVHPKVDAVQLRVGSSPWQQPLVRLVVLTFP